MPMIELGKGEYPLEIVSTRVYSYYIGALMLTNFGSVFYIGDPIKIFKYLRPFLIIKEEQPMIHQINFKNTSLEKEKIIKIVSGEHHFCCLTESGNVFVLGDLLNGDYSTFFDQHLSSKVLKKNEKFANPFLIIRFPTLRKDEKIIDISSGNYHVLVMTNQDRSSVGALIVMGLSVMVKSLISHGAIEISTEKILT